MTIQEKVDYIIDIGDCQACRVLLKEEVETLIAMVRAEASQTPQEAAGDVIEEKVEEVPMKMRESDAPPLNFPEQTPCARCHKPKWKHYSDEVVGFATCREFVDIAQAHLV